MQLNVMIDDALLQEAKWVTGLALDKLLLQALIALNKSIKPLPEALEN